MEESHVPSAVRSNVRRGDVAPLSLSGPAGQVLSDVRQQAERSLPVAVGTAVAGAVDGAAPTTTVERLETALVALDAYGRLRVERPGGDDDSLLAGDYLLASARSNLVAADPDRGRRCHRALSRGSTAFIESVHESQRAEPSPGDRPNRAHPPSVLAGLAAELGAIVAGGGQETAAAFRAYGRSVGRAGVDARRGETSDPSGGVESIVARFRDPYAAEGHERTRLDDSDRDRLEAWQTRAIRALKRADAAGEVTATGLAALESATVIGRRHTSEEYEEL